jgi:hypothetical protein
VSAVMVSDWSGAKGSEGVAQTLKLRVIRDSGADIQFRKEQHMSKVGSFGRS